jgi:prepilin-type N-terminal cleavage/methylation domain-containing protein
MSRRRGFTLLEVLIAIAVLLALVGSMFGFLSGTMDARHRASEHIQRQDAATRLIDDIEVALTHCLVGDSVYGAGVRGDSTRLHILSRSVMINLAKPGATGEQVDPLFDLQVSEYRFDPAGPRIVGYRAPANPGRSGRAEPAMQPLGGMIHRLRFRYYDGSTWRSSFDSLAVNQLPTAVEVAVWFHPQPEDIQDTDVDAFAPQLTEDAAEEAGGSGRLLAQDSLAETEVAGGQEKSATDGMKPDRVRIILIPDAAVVDAASATGADSRADGFPGAAREEGVGP